MGKKKRTGAPQRNSVVDRLLASGSRWLDGGEDHQRWVRPDELPRDRQSLDLSAFDRRHEFADGPVQGVPGAASSVGLGVDPISSTAHRPARPAFRECLP